MSHVALINAQLLDLDCLARAAKKLGLKFNKNQKKYKWFGKHVGDYPLPQGFKKEELGTCEHSISIPGNDRAYEIGVVKRRDGQKGYTMLWDFWQGGYGLEAKIGKNGQTLIDEYTTQVVIKDRMEQGYDVTRTVNDQGETVLRCTK